MYDLYDCYLMDAINSEMSIKKEIHMFALKKIIQLLIRLNSNPRKSYLVGIF